jgi:uncharacterized protein YtpQ (UPF0354 family)
MATGDFTSRAIAYLQVKRPALSPGPVVTLSGPDAPVMRDLGGGLLVAYVVDEGDHFAYTQGRHLAAEGRDEDELHAIGLVNLTRLAADSLRVAPYPPGEMFAVLMGGHFEASMILLDDLWDRAFRQFVQGDYVVALPARDLLAFADASSEAGVQDLRALIARAQASGADHPLTDRLYRRAGGRWEPFEG